MSADTARKYRAYPTPDQAERLTEWAHTCRAVWNLALEQRQYVWQQRRYTLRAVEQALDALDTVRLEEVVTALRNARAAVKKRQALR